MVEGVVVTSRAKILNLGARVGAVDFELDGSRIAWRRMSRCYFVRAGPHFRERENQSNHRQQQSCNDLSTRESVLESERSGLASMRRPRHTTSRRTKVGPGLPILGDFRRNVPGTDESHHLALIHDDCMMNAMLLQKGGSIVAGGRGSEGQELGYHDEADFLVQGDTVLIGSDEIGLGENPSGLLLLVHDHDGGNVTIEDRVNDVENGVPLGAGDDLRGGDHKGGDEHTAERVLMVEC